MTPWEERVLTLLLRTTHRQTRPPGALLAAQLETEPHCVRVFWGPRARIGTSALVMLPLMIECMRTQDAPSFFVSAWWPQFMEYLREDWRLIHPRTGKRVNVRHAFATFKQRHDCRTNAH